MAIIHPSQRCHALNLIRQTKELLQSENQILASTNDCDYFRNIYRSLRESQTTNFPKKTSLPDTLNISLPKPRQQLSPPEEIHEPSTVLEKKNPTSDLSIATLATPPTPEPKTEIPRFQESSPIPIIENVFVPKPREKWETFEDIRKILSRTFPEMRLLTDIPSDAPARRIAERWKTKNQAASISILSFHELTAQHQFLTNFAQAIDITFGHAKLISAEGIETDNLWESFLSVADLKLVIICDYSLWQMPHLLQFYREIPNKTERFLQSTPVMLLPDLSLYLKDPQLKRSLWKALCLKIASL